MDAFSKDRLWLFVTKNNETSTWEVLAANDWGGQLGKEKLETLRQFCATMSGKLNEAPESAEKTAIELQENEALCHATASR